MWQILRSGQLKQDPDSLNCEYETDTQIRPTQTGSWQPELWVCDRYSSPASSYMILKAWNMSMWQTDTHIRQLLQEPNSLNESGSRFQYPTSLYGSYIFVINKKFLFALCIRHMVPSICTALNVFCAIWINVVRWLSNKIIFFFSDTVKVHLTDVNFFLSILLVFPRLLFWDSHW